MTKVRGRQLLIQLAGNANNAVLPPNPNRIFVSVSGGQTAASLVSFGLEGASANNGDRYTNTQPPLRYHINEIGTLIQQQLNIWNAGSAQAASIFEGFI